jgi:hypothetical protein
MLPLVPPPRKDGCWHKREISTHQITSIREKDRRCQQ